STAEVILKFYKDQNALLNNKELGREQVCVSATNYCGLEYCYRYPKNIHVLTIVLSQAVILLSFETHERLLDWYHKIKNTLPSAVEFRIRVSIPTKGKLPSGRATFYFYNNHFAITPETPTRLVCAWNLRHVIRYGSFEGGFAFSVKVLHSAKSSNYLLLLDNPESIKNHFDAATLKHLPSRWSTHSETNPAIRDEEQGTLAAERQRLLNENTKDLGQDQSGGHERTLERILERTVESNENEEPQEGDALMAGADLNRNTQLHSDSGVSSSHVALGNDVIELTDLGIRESQSWTSVARTEGSSRSRTEDNSRSNLMIEEAGFEQEMLLCPQKNTPIREQEYEVMASFDHYRSSIHEDVDSGSPCLHQRHLESSQETHAPCHSSSHRGAGGGGGMSGSQSRIQYLINMDRFKLNLAATPDVREYVNLPSPNTTKLSNTLPSNRPKRSKPVLPTLPNSDILDSFNFSPPSSPPPAPPIQKRYNSSFSSLKETSIHVGLYPSLDSARESFKSLQEDEDIPVPIPFDHATLVKPLGPIARLKRNSQDSETSSYIASGSEYDSSHYSSAASSRHNSFDRDPFLSKPPPVPPKSANLRLPSIEMLLSSGNFNDENLSIPGLSSMPSSQQDNVPPIPPKPDHLRGKPLLKGPQSPISPTGRPPFLPPRKRCNTVPSFATEEGDTEWVELPDEQDDGYLIMKPVYDNKLKSMHTRSKSVPDEETAHSQTLPLMPRSWQTPSSPRLQSPGTPTFSEPCSPVMEFIPQSPIHNPEDMRIQTLRRSATIGGFGRRASRSPSFAGRRPSLLRNSRQRRSLRSDPGNSHRTSDISLNSAPPRRRRKDKYGSLDHRSMSLGNTKLEDFKDESQEIPSSPTNGAMSFHPDDFQELKDELDKFAGPLSLSPPSSVNSPSGTPPLTPASSEESIHEPDQIHSLP
ncbi:uncharacterized protein LOC121432182, partial [Lytechinus variegatus]|uniref:uncharacterized protein LOC121432182 n=1 Tax=Lytechinus variegatus TaxID=7654 RepID=UPI001BB2CFB5